ncbi:DUF397 domain-containing protein [Cryptosporangium arvum]|uniref:DUF397 domain-containing protein n=1 Tax=Cryptosporangium arvum TaxID=80871 RepID=UPI000A010B12
MPTNYLSAGWRTARRCSQGNCVEVRSARDVVHVRDSNGRVLSASPEAWAAFVREIKAAEA